MTLLSSNVAVVDPVELFQKMACEINMQEPDLLEPEELEERTATETDPA